MNSTKSNLKNIEINPGLAEYYGAMIGDGCLSRYHTKDRKAPRSVVLLTGHTHDEPYYREVIRPIVFKEFGINGYIQFRKEYNVVYFRIESKSVFNFFNSLGFPIGLKNNKLTINEKILSNNRLSLACVRGIFDTDGTIYRRYLKQYSNHYRLYNYQNIQFKLKSYKVIKQIKYILENNRIKTTKIGFDNIYPVFRICNQKMVHKFMELVKPSNKYHTARYLNNIKFSHSAGL